MNRFHRAALLLAALLPFIAVAGCGESGDTVDDVRSNIERVQTMVDDQGFMLSDIPIPIDVGEDGRVTEVGGMDVAVIDDAAERLTGNPIFGRIVLLDEDQVAWFKRANIQHVTVASRPEGLFVLVNGEALPYLAWDEASIDALVDVLGRFQENDTDGAYLLKPDVYDALEVALPLVRSLGVRFDVRFPRDESQAEIPLPGAEDFDLALSEEEIDRVPLQNVNMEIEYRRMPDGEDWVPSLFGFTTVDLQAASEPLDYDVPQLRLRRDIRRRLKAEGISSTGLEARADGLFVTVNGELLPHLAWSEATLTNLTTILLDLYPEGTNLPDDARWVPLLRSTAPMYNDFALAILIRFPIE